MTAKKGRRLKLTPETQAKLCTYIRGGCPYIVAVGCVGIEESTFYRWLRLGEKAKSGIYFQFSQSIKKAKDDAEAERVLKIRSIAMGEEPTERIEIKDKKTGEVTKVITKMGRPEWTALAWLLERQHPERWAKTERLQVGDADGKPLPAPIQFVLPDGVKIRPPRNGDKPNGDGTVEYTPSDASTN